MDFRVTNIQPHWCYVDWRPTEAEDWRPTGLCVAFIADVHIIGLCVDMAADSPDWKYRLLGTVVPDGYARPDFSEWMNSQIASTGAP